MMLRREVFLYVALGALLAIGSYLAIHPVLQWAALGSMRAPIIVSLSGGP